MSPVPRVSRRRTAIIGFIAAVVLAIPMGVLASHQFGDVPNSNPYHADIDALVDSGVTGGCGGGNYCPTSFVTRQTMAAFLNRLGALQAGKTPVVNAKTSQSTDGWSFGCPSGTVWTQGLCFEQTNRTADTVYDASDTCAAAGPLLGGHRYRLPTIHQLRSARGASGITLDAAGEHTDSLYIHDLSFFSFLAFDNGAITEVLGNTERKFRCVTEPQSLDPFIIIIPLDEEQNRYPAPPTYDDTVVGEDGSPAGE